ncbi:MAG TPA: DUF4271 domain-containing protein [Segetibacter sp.]
MKKLLFILFFFFAGYLAIGQTDTNSTTIVADTTARIKPAPRKPIKRRIVRDTTLRLVISDSIYKADSLRHLDSTSTARVDTPAPLPNNSAATRPVVVKRPIDSIYLRLLDNPFFRSKAKPIYLVVNERRRVSKDEIFYLMAGILLLLAFIKLVFGRFFTNLFRLFFQPSFRQKQTREQLQQNNLPSLLLNLFFVFSAATYISFLLEYYHFAMYSFWKIFLFSAASLATIYIGKFIFLSFAGWVFNAKEATDAYIFAVYLINKVMGVILIPFTLIIAFSEPNIINICITISILLILLLFIYRYRVSYGTIRREVKVSPLHFLFYIYAFEIIPLLVIYKTLVIYLNKSL